VNETERLKPIIFFCLGKAVDNDLLLEDDENIPQEYQFSGKNLTKSGRFGINIA
jgi:hypothetical protein